MSFGTYFEERHAAGRRLKQLTGLRESVQPADRHGHVTVAVRGFTQIVAHLQVRREGRRPVEIGRDHGSDFDSIIHFGQRGTAAQALACPFVRLERDALQAPAPAASTVQSPMFAPTS